MKCITGLISWILSKISESSYDGMGPEQFNSHAEYMDSLSKLDEKDFEAGMETLHEHENAHRAELNSLM